MRDRAGGLWGAGCCLKSCLVGGGMTTTRTEKGRVGMIRNSKWERNCTGLSAITAAVGLETGGNGCRSLGPPTALYLAFRSSSSSGDGRNCRAHPRRSLLDHSGRNR